MVPDVPLSQPEPVAHNDVSAAIRTSAPLLTEQAEVLRGRLLHASLAEVDRVWMLEHLARVTAALAALAVLFE